MIEPGDVEPGARARAVDVYQRADVAKRYPANVYLPRVGDGRRDEYGRSGRPQPVPEPELVPELVPVPASSGDPDAGSGAGSGVRARREVRQSRVGADPAVMRVPSKVRPRRMSPAWGGLVEVVVVIVMALGLALLIKTFLVQAFFIPSASMDNTLLTGDRVLVSKLTPGVFSLHRGDIVVFKDPGGWLGAQPQEPTGPVQSALRSALTFVGLLPQDSGEHLIKRVIGLPGDTVMCCDAQGRIRVNGVSINEPYLFPGNAPSTENFKVTVPAGRLWVMGDHRSDSADSRAHPNLFQGTVPIENVVGKAFVVVWPLDRLTGLGVPSSVFTQVPDPQAAP